MDMAKVFEEQIIRTTEHKLNTALEKLKKNEILQQDIRELTDITHRLKKTTFILKELTSDDEERKEWKLKHDNLVKRRDELYSKIGHEGFEYWWINTIIDSEAEQLKAVLKAAREAARKKHLEDEEFKDIDAFDKRLDLIGADIELARTLYIQGQK